MSRAQLTSTDQQNSGGPVSPFVAGKNKIINGDFGVWQRGTSFTPTSGSFTADRWRNYFDGSGSTRTYSQQTFTPGSAPVAGYEGTYFLRLNQSVAGSGGTYNELDHAIESVRTFAGQTVTLSFWAKAESSTTTGSINLRQAFVSASPNVDNIITSSVSLTTNWQRFSFTMTLPSVAGKTISSNASDYLQVIWSLPLNATFTIDTWGWQLEAGSVATPFTTASGTLQGELALCQRYFQVLLNGSNNAYENFGISTFWASNRLLFNVRLPVTMRTSPTLTISAASDFVIENGPTGGYVANNWDSFDISPRIANGSFYCAGGPFTPGYSGRIRSNGTSNSRFYADAEL
jgi:hypothetical protein